MIIKLCYIGKNNQVYPLNIKNKKGKTYVPAKQMRTNVHVSHWHIQREGKYNIIDNRKMGILTDLPEYKTIMKIFLKMLEKCQLCKKIF